MKTTIAVTIDAVLIATVDGLVAEAQFHSRSQAIEVALTEMLDRFRPGRLARECAKLDPGEEKALAEEGLVRDFVAWPNA